VTGRVPPKHAVAPLTIVLTGLLLTATAAVDWAFPDVRAAGDVAFSPALGAAIGAVVIGVGVAAVAATYWLPRY